MNCAHCKKPSARFIMDKRAFCDYACYVAFLKHAPHEDVSA